MKILIIASYAPSLIAFRGDLMKAMLRQGHVVIAVAPAVSGIRDELREMGVECRSISLSRTGTNPIQDLRSLLELRSLIRHERPERVLAYTIKPVIYGSIATRLAGSASMYSMITGLGSTFVGKGLKQWIIGKITRWLYRLAIRMNAGVFFQNHDDLADFTRLGILDPRQSTFLINGSGVNLARFKQIPVPSSPVFLLIARIIADKGIREYVLAAQEVRRVCPECRCLLVGWFDSNPSGITREEVKSWCDEGTIEYMGAVDDVRPVLASCRVFVLPSYREGTPRTVLEAMSVGRPVITTEAPGCKETVQDGVNGFLVPVGDSRRLAAAMIEMIREPELAEKMGAASRRLAEEKYDVHKINSTILDAMGLT